MIENSAQLLGDVVIYDARFDFDMVIDGVTYAVRTPRRPSPDEVYMTDPMPNREYEALAKDSERWQRRNLSRLIAAIVGLIGSLYLICILVRL